MRRKPLMEDPPEQWALTICREIEQGNRIDQAIVERLVARPKRFAELQPILAGKGKNNLTQALKRLQLRGVIHMRTDVLREPPVSHYELTPLGARVAMILAGRAYFEHLATRAAAGEDLSSSTT